MPPAEQRSGGTDSSTESTPRSDDSPRSDEAPRSDVAPRPKHYTQLPGQAGRRAYFRPERYKAASLGVGVTVLVNHAGENCACALHDVSQSGLALEWPDDHPVEVGDVLDEVVLHFDEHEAYRGSARVSSVRRARPHAIVGASFTDGLMNIEDVLHLRDVKAHVTESAAPETRLDMAPWRTPGQDRFKAGVAELRLFLEDAEIRFAEMERVLPWHVVHGEQSSPARLALIERVRCGFAADVVKMSNTLDAALREAGPEQENALREYSERHLGELLMHSPWLYRARHKPLGYPGDFEVMNGLYGRHFSGPTLFAKALNLAFVSTPAAEAVRTRKDLLKGELSQVIDEAEPGAELRLLSVAAGPAEEIYELLAERAELDVRLEIVLFDQDKSALSFSYGRLSQLVAERWSDRVKVVHLHDSITRLLRGSSVLSHSGHFSAVYACGLFDYLQPHSWVSMCRSLYALASPGGRVLIGNMVPQSPCRWFMELHLDWFLEYREPDELIRLAQKAAPNARVDVLEEATKINPFVRLRRM